MAASREPALRAVKAGETKKPEKPKTLLEAVELGDYREILVAQRREIARDIPNERGPAKAALHRQLGIIAKELEQLDLRAKEEAREDAIAPDEAWDAEAL